MPWRFGGPSNTLGDEWGCGSLGNVRPKSALGIVSQVWPSLEAEEYDAHVLSDGNVPLFITPIGVTQSVAHQ